MLTPEQFHKSESKYKPGDFKTSKEEISFAKGNDYNDRSYHPKLTSSEKKEARYFFIGMTVIILLTISVCTNILQYQENKKLFKKVSIQEALITGYYEGNYGK